jgi:hypothetical protein
MHDDFTPLDNFTPFYDKRRKKRKILPFFLLASILTLVNRNVAQDSILVLVG